MVAKAAGGIIGIGLIGTGGIAMAKPHWLGIDYMPKWHSLSEDNDFNTAYSDANKFGKKYKNYLVGVTNKTKGDDNTSNKAWWDWAFRRLQKAEVKSGKFKVKGDGANNVEIAYDNSSTNPNSKALNQVCKAAYETNDSNGFGNGDSQFSKDDVWKYCSPGKLKTTSEDEGTHDANKIGWDNTNKTTLISVKDSSNDWFWEIRNKDFWEDEDSEWSGKKATTGSDSNKSLFKAAYEKKETSKPPIKELCRQAYKQPTSSSKDSDDAKKFCKLEGSTT